MHDWRILRLRSPLGSHRRRHWGRDATLASIGDSPFPLRRQALHARREAAKQHFGEDYYKSLSACKNKMLFLQKYTHAQMQQNRLPYLHPLYISSLQPNPCLSANKAGRVTTLDVPCDSQFLVTLQGEARQATPAHRQPSLSLKLLHLLPISAVSPCPPGMFGGSKGTNHTVSVSSISSVSNVAQAFEGTIWSLLALANVSRTAVRE